MFGFYRLYLDCTIAVFGTGGVVLPIRPLMPKSCAKKNCVDCSWIVLIVFGLCRKGIVDDFKKGRSYTVLCFAMLKHK